MTDETRMPVEAPLIITQKVNHIDKRIRRTFSGGTDFEAMHAAEKWCRENDIAIGAMQRDSPRGLLYGRDQNVICKWRTLSPQERRAMDGTMTTTATFRTGPVQVSIRFPTTP